MKLSKCFKLAMGSIISSKMRSFLTMLGIIIGIAAVIALVSIMNSVTGQVTDAFSQLGTTRINVSIQNNSEASFMRLRCCFVLLRNILFFDVVIEYD